MYFRHRINQKILFSFLELAFIINLLILDIAVLGKTPLPPLAATTQYPPRVIIASPLAASPSASCGITCTPTLTATPTQQPLLLQDNPSNDSVKEVFIPFGSGQSSTVDWTNVTGLQTYIDSTKYLHIKTLVFEASVHIPTGNEWANVRLYNVTDQHPVWYSDVSLAGGDPKFLISHPITLDSGNKLYQVQMSTQLQYPAILDQARIHITVN